MAARNSLPKNKASKKENLEKQLITSSYHKSLEQTVSKVSIFKEDICR